MSPLRVSSLLSLFALLIASGGAQSQTWKKYSYAADGFEVEFSDTVKTSPTTINEETAKRVVRATDYLQGGDDYAYVVGASLLKQEVNFDNGVKASFAALKCNTTKSEAQLTFPGGKARELLGTDCLDGEMRADARYFTKAKWFYQIIALIKKDGGDVASARRFLESFKVTLK